jgi:predicted nuclease of restriction endonuclease-like (RecB) superfamily
MKDKLMTDEQLYAQVAELIELARKKVAAAVNLTMVHTYFEIGRMIIEQQQLGKDRAAYGQQILKSLSEKLTAKFGKGFSVENLDRMRFFYKAYAQKNSSTALTNFELSWSHYLVLMRIENQDERNFYEIESKACNWSLKELSRQCNSALYQRLALSRDKEKVAQLAQKGQVITSAQDIIKDPLVLEFLGLEERSAYSESQLERKIIDHLQFFLLELGKGFAFIGRQVRFTFDEQHFRVDLVFYNRLLKCFVVIDLKLGKITHQDLGQIQMYVNYYDRHVKLADENPTIGILLCQKKNDAIVELTLPKDANIYAPMYSLYLPDKQLLQQKLTEWSADFNNVNTHADESF